MANYPASQPGSKRHTLSVLVENRPGVLARIAGLFARRAFNINSLSVSPTERPDISRVTVTADVEEVPLEQIIKQLNKLLHVLKIVDLDPETTVERELVLIKVAADESNRSDVLEIVRLFRVRVVDVNPESLTIEATGAEGKIDALLGLLEHYGIIELVRSGAVAVTRGPEAEREGARLRDHRSLNGLSGIPTAKRRPTIRFVGRRFLFRFTATSYVPIAPPWECYEWNGNISPARRLPRERRRTPASCHGTREPEATCRPRRCRTSKAPGPEPSM